MTLSALNPMAIWGVLAGIECRSRRICFNVLWTEETYDGHQADYCHLPA